MTSYATPDDFKTWSGDATATISQRDLDRAQVVIDELTIGVQYDLATAADALKRATCAQAAWFDDTGDPSGARAVLGGASIGSLSVGATGTSGNNSVDATTARYAPEAIGILKTAGLLRRTVAHW